jgi:bifunctional UDP-N-acetylglucosamine pyrophosphorylase/glucosamine-1-phosphate N-acetyltransferase
MEHKREKIQMNKTIGVVLAAGQGKRFQAKVSKPYACLLGQPLLQWVTEALIEAQILEIVWVIRKADEVLAKKLKHFIQKQKSVRISLIFQTEHEKGTGAALKQSLDQLKFMAKPESQLVVVPADNPAIEPSTIKKLLESSDDLTICALNLANPQGYGRLILDSSKKLVAIREEKECSKSEKSISLVFTGLLAGRLKCFQTNLRKLLPSPLTNEIYLTDLVEVLHKNKSHVSFILSPSRDDVTGINTLEDLEKMHFILQKRIIKSWMKEGVKFINPLEVYLDKTVSLSKGLVIPPGVVLNGDLILTPKSKLEPGMNLGEARDLDWFLEGVTSQCVE